MSLVNSTMARPMPRPQSEAAYIMDIFTAASLGENKVIDKHISCGADLTARNASGWTALHYAAYLGHDSTAKLCLDHGAQVDGCNSRAQTALMLAAACGNATTVNLLLSRGASVDRTDSTNRQPLHYAAACSQNTVADILLAASADPNALDNDGMTPTLEACASVHELTLLSLLEKGGDPGRKNNRGDDGASLASDSPQLVKLIVQHKKNSRQPSTLTELLAALQLDRLMPKLNEQGIDLRIFFTLNEKDFDDMGVAYGPKKKMLKVIQKYKESGTIVVEQFDNRATMPAGVTDEAQQTAAREMASTLRFVKEGNENIKQYALEALEKLANSSNATQLRSLITNIIDLTEQVAARTARHVHK